ncbi:hypothetical protein [Pseudoalteromonas sp. 1181_04]|uniref:hypothetical protein n=1 Tax=Pseudoalteromonas sp. 1181_04 TaxID=2604450 RepID=UPI0040639814
MTSLFTELISRYKTDKEVAITTINYYGRVDVDKLFVEPDVCSTLVVELAKEVFDSTLISLTFADTPKDRKVAIRLEKYNFFICLIPFNE